MLNAVQSRPEVHHWPPCHPVQVHQTPWQPSIDNPKVTLNLVLDGCIVPTQAGTSARVDYSHLVVLDNFIDEDVRQQLLHYLTEPGWRDSRPPGHKWEQATCDGAGKARTWGLSDAVLQQFAASDIPAKLEVQTRLCKLYPDMIIAHMPSNQIQLGLMPTAAQQQEEDQQEASVDCSCFLANAAVAADTFSWHVDADPEEFPMNSPWTNEYGTYCNREPGKPLFVSLLLYLDAEWPLDYDAETLFLDSMTDTGVFVRPKRCRAVLLDQDVVHRLSTPSAAAGRPRYSLVWKLVMFPKKAGGRCSIAKSEWGKPIYFGSAARVEKAIREVSSADTVPVSKKRLATDVRKG